MSFVQAIRDSGREFVMSGLVALVITLAHVHLGAAQGGRGARQGLARSSTHVGEGAEMRQAGRKQELFH